MNALATDIRQMLSKRLEQATLTEIWQFAQSLGANDDQAHERRFTKVDCNGRHVSDAVTDWVAVYDADTRLTWTRDLLPAKPWKEALQSASDLRLLGKTDWRASLQGHSAPDRQAGANVAASLTAGSHPGSNAPGRRREDDVNLVSHALLAKPNDAHDASMQTYVASTLRAESGRNQIESNYVAITAGTLGAHSSSGRSYGSNPIADNLITHALTGEGFDASEDGTGRGTPLTVAFNARQDPDSWIERTGPLETDGSTQAIAFNLRGREGGSQAEIAEVASLRSASGGSSRSYVGFAQNQRNEVRLMDVAGAPASEPGMKQQTYVHGDMAVRRLTPLECERLQGYEDRYTAIIYKGKPAKDGPRYKALGNSMAVPVMRWIGRRIELVNSLASRTREVA